MILLKGDFTIMAIELILVLRPLVEKCFLASLPLILQRRHQQAMEIFCLYKENLLLLNFR